MAKHKAASCSPCHTVYIQTNLETHLAIPVTDVDTVQGFKEKLSAEHCVCFPSIGDITVNSLKVRRRGCFFHLADSMLVKNAFDGVDKYWYLYVDAVSTPLRSAKKPLYLKAPNNINPQSSFLADNKKLESDALEKHDLAGERNDTPNTSTKHKKGKSRKRKADISCDDVSREDLQSGPVVKRKRPSEKEVEASLKQEHNSGISMPTQDISRQGHKFHDNYLDGKIRNVKLDGVSAKQSEDHHSSSHSLVSDKSRKARKSTILQEKGDSEDLTEKTVLHESSMDKSRNIHKVLSDEADVTVPSQQSPKNIRVLPAKEIEDGTLIPSSSLGTRHAISAAMVSFDEVGLDSLQDVDMGGACDSTLEIKVDVSENLGGRKEKKSKKHKDTNADEAEMNRKDGICSYNPLDASCSVETEGPGKKQRKKSKRNKGADSVSHEGIPPLTSNNREINKELSSLPQNETIPNSKFCSSDNCIDTDVNDKIEVKTALLQDEGPYVVSESLDAAGATEVQDPSKKRKKKSKKSKAFNNENNVSASGAEHVESTKDVIQPISESYKVSVQNNSVVSYTEGLKDSREESQSIPVLGLDNEYLQGSKDEDTSLQLPQTVSFKPTDAAEVRDAQDPADNKKKKRKKTKASKSNISTSEVDHVESAGISIQPTSESYLPSVQNNPGIETKREHNILPQTEGMKAQGSENEDTFLQVAQAVSAESLDAAGATEPQDPCGRRKKKSKKIKASRVMSNVSASGLEHDESVVAVQPVSESHIPIVQDTSGIETKGWVNILPQTEGLKASKLESPSAPVLGSYNKDSQCSEQEDTSLQLAQSVRVQQITNNGDDKVKRKLIKPPVWTSTSMTEPEMKQVVNSEDTSLSTNGKKEEEKATYKKVRKSKSKKDSSVPEAENGNGFRIDSMHHPQLSDNVGPPQVLSNVPNYNAGGKHPLNASTDGDKNYIGVSKNDDHAVNFRDYFVHTNDNNEVVAPAPAKEPIKKGVQEKDTKVDKKAKMHSLGTTFMEKSQDFIGDQGQEKKSQCTTSFDFELQRSQTRPDSDENASITVRERVKTTLDADEKVENFPSKVSKNKTVDSLEDESLHALQFHSPAGINAHSSSKVNIETSEKSYSKEAENVLNVSQYQKSFLAASNTRGSSSESSEDKDDYHSDVSTKSPSDTSSSSDHSGGGNLTPANGYYVRKIADNGGNHSIKSQFTAGKNMGLNAILRSSKSYKKAKLIASQSQPEDTESQPIDFNLDSQA